MALEDELAKLTRRRGGPGKPRGERGVGFVVASIGIALLLVIVGAGRASGFARTGPNEVGVVYNGGPLDKKTQRQLIAPSSGLTWTGLAEPGPAAVPVGGLAAALHHHERAERRRPRRRRQRAGADRGRRRRRARGEDQLHHRRSPAPATTSSMKEFDARFGNRTYPVPTGGTRLHPVGRRRGVRRVPRHRVPPRARQRAARDDRALQVQRADLLVRAAPTAEHNALGKGSGDKTNANLIQVQQAIAKALNRRPLRATSAATTSRACR